MMGLSSPTATRLSTPRYRTVLFGDSMTSQHFIDTANTASYSSATGVLTITQTGHGLPSGWYVDVFNRSYSALKIHQRLPITVIDANTYTVQLAAGLSGVPNGALTGTTYCRIPTRIGSNGWFTWLQIASGYRFNLIYNGAQSGDTTTDNLARIHGHCLVHRPEVVFMQLAGINDCSLGQQASEETIWTNQQSIMSQITATGARLIVLTVTPVASGEARATLQNMERVARMRKRLFDYAANNPGIIVVDAYRRVVDPADTTGLALATKLKATDHIHYSILGSREIGEAVWSQISSLFPSRPDTLPASRIDSYASSAVTLTSVSRASNVITATATAHGFLTGESGKVTGGTSEVLNAWVPVTAVNANTVSFPSTGADGNITGTILLGRNNNLYPNPILSTATGGTVSAPATGTAAGNIRCRVYGSIATATASVVADPDGFGNRQRFVVTPAAADDRAAIEMSTTSLLNTVVVAGRTYYLEAWVKLKDVVGSNLSEIMFRLIVNVDGTLYSVFALNSYDSTPINTDFEGMLRTAKMVIPPGTISQFYWEFAPRFSAAGTALTMEIGRINLVEVDGL